MRSAYEQQHDRTSNYERNDPYFDGSTSSTTTTYRSIMAPRLTNVQRSRPNACHASGVSTRLYQSYVTSNLSSQGFGGGLASLLQSNGVPMRGPGSGSLGTQTAIVGINATRLRDKNDLQNLNDKFAQYIEKVRYLEAQNRKLIMELQMLQERAGQGSSRIKEMYDIEMSEAKLLIDNIRREAADATLNAKQAEQVLEVQRTRYNDVTIARNTDQKDLDSIQQQIAENEAQIALFRRRIADLDDESRRYKNECNGILNQIDQIQFEIHDQMSLRSSADIDKVTVEDAIRTCQQQHEADLAELRAQHYTNGLDPSQFFRNELSEAIREIREEFDARTNTEKQLMQNRYSLIINEIIIQNQQPGGATVANEQHRRQLDKFRNELIQSQTQNAYLNTKIDDIQNAIAGLQNEIQDLKEKAATDNAKSQKDLEEARRHLDKVSREYAAVTEYRTSLEKEIATYREQLEGADGLRGCVDRIVQSVAQQAIEQPVKNYSAYHYRSHENIYASRDTSLYSSLGGVLSTDSTAASTTSNIARNRSDPNLSDNATNVVYTKSTRPETQTVTSPNNHPSTIIASHGVSIASPIRNSVRQDSRNESSTEHDRPISHQSYRADLGDPVRNHVQFNNIVSSPRTLSRDNSTIGIMNIPDDDDK